MSGQPASGAIKMDEADVEKANRNVINYLDGTLKDSRMDLNRLRSRLEFTYGIIVFLSIVMFIIGIVLLSIPALAAYNHDIESLKAITAAGFGLADLVALFLFRPVEQIRNIMGDMAQLMLALQSFQSQAALRLLEMKIEDRATVGVAAEKISDAAKNSIILVKEYFEK